MNLLLLSIYLLEGILFGVLGVALKRKHSNFPDCSMGYHHKRAMASKETWDYANHTAGNICGVCSIAFFAVSALLYFTNTSVGTAVVILFALSLGAVAGVLILPLYLLKIKFY